MNIEWNKVTWYSKVAAVIVFVLVFAVGMYVGMQYAGESSTQPVATTTSENAAHAASAPAKTSTASANPAAGKIYAYTVSLTSSGFSPKTIQIKPGVTVHFVNTTSGTMRIFSDTFQQTKPYYTGFDEAHSVGKNGTYDYLFNDPGVWTYYNLNGSPQITGTVIVQP